MNKEQFIQSGLLEQYALGLTSPDEDFIVRQHLEAFPELESHLQQLQHSLDSYAIEQISNIIPPASAPPDKRALVNQNTKFSPAWLLAIVLAGLCTYLYNGQQHQQKDITQLEAEYAALKEYCDAKSNNDTGIKVFALMHDTNTRSILLKGTAIAPEHYAMAYWNASENAGWIDPTHLPALPKGKKYCVWADVDHHMTYIGEFNNTTLAYITVNYLDGAASLNITVEEDADISEPDVAQLAVQGLL